MSTVNNNSSAWATRVLPGTDLDILFYLKVGPGAINNSTFTQPFEVDFGGGGGGNYLQLYLDQLSEAPAMRLWVNYFGDASVANFENSIDIWRKFRLRRSANSWSFQHAAVGASSWTNVSTFTEAAAGTITMGWWASFRDGPGNYLMPGGSSRNLRIYSTVLADADALSDLDSITPTQSNLWASYMNGANPNPANFYVDESGNGRDMTPTGIAVPDSDDPIVVSLPSVYNSLYFGTNF